MNFWKKLGIRTQITAGFLPLLGLMSLLSVNGINAMGGLSEMFSFYRQTAAQSLAISDYSNQLHEIQLAAQAFQSTPNQDVVSRFEAGVKAFSVDDTRLAGNPELVQGMAAIRDDVSAYDKAFQTIVQLQAEREALISKVTEFGPWTTVALNDVIRSAWRQGDVRLMHMTGDTLDALNRSLYFSERFIHANDMDAYNAA